MITILRQKLRKYYLWHLLKNEDCSAENFEWYFGYGANQNSSRFSDQRCHFIEGGTACLKDFEIDFSLPTSRLGMGFANVKPKLESEVWGQLTKLSPLSLRLLDLLEWVSYGYYQRYKVSVTPALQEKPVDAWIYRSKLSVDGLIPSTEYKKALLGTAEKYRYPQSYSKTIDSHQAKLLKDFQLNPNFLITNPAAKRSYPVFLNAFLRINDRWRAYLFSKLP